MGMLKLRLTLNALLSRFKLSASPLRRQISLYYLAGVVALAVIGAMAGHYALVLLLWWGALALAGVATIYAGPGAPGFQKKDGVHSLFILVLLAPYLLGARLHQRLRTRNYASPCHVRDRVWIGRLPYSSEMARSQFASLLDLTAELAIAPGHWRYSSLPWLDVVTPSRAGLDAAAHEIEALRSEGGDVLVSCALGHTRSACAVAAWLLATRRAQNTANAISQVRSARPQAVFRARHRQVLAECESP